ncbi:MAG: hypothetical protein ACT4PE_08605 [Candidatus Eiseniibacteriota bacterium]
MNRLRVASLAAFLTAASFHPVSALEKRAMLMPEHVGEEWGAAATVTLAYYNICTGWIWAYSGWAEGEQVGVYFEPDCSLPALIRASSVLTFDGPWSGYGYTGTIAIVSADDCSGQIIASQPWVGGDGWNDHTWNVEVSASVQLACVTGVEATSWGRVKGIYE